jgi:hypothetical protein
MEDLMKKTIVIAVWSIVAAGWIGIVAYKMLADPALKEWTIAVAAGALALEAAFWVTAAVLGISLLQSRKKAFGALLRPFRRGDR